MLLGVCGPQSGRHVGIQLAQISLPPARLDSKQATNHTHNMPHLICLGGRANTMRDFVLFFFVFWRVGESNGTTDFFLKFSIDKLDILLI
jgi:hypothetical protein